MKKLTFLFLAFLISGFAFGQDTQQRVQQRDPEQSAKLYTERLTKELDLSSEQQKRVYELTLDRSKKAKDRGFVKRGEMNKERAGELRAERKAHQDELESILTPEQVKKWNEKRAAMVQDRGKRDRGDMKNRGNRMRDTTNK